MVHLRGYPAARAVLCTRRTLASAISRVYMPHWPTPRWCTASIVKKNAIMMVDFALEAQRHGNLTPQEAIFQACLLRFRPIMMTTLAALFGALPLVLSGGDGSELRQPLGITIVGGLVMSQLLTLYTTPVVYLFFDRLRLRFSRKPKQTVTE